MYYGAIKECDIADGIGVRTTIFVSGCTNCCEGCFQPQTWDFRYGQPFTSETEELIFEYLKPDYIRGLTVLGGEPFEPSNQEVLVPFLEEYKRRYPGKDLWVFTGFRLDDEITVPGEHPNCGATTDRFLALIDVLVDGRFILAKRDLTLKYRGSSNQRIIDMNKTREKGDIVLWDESLAST
ncbi:MAG: anaerobic ribonucleoside-triphosphate reductase activating protein [Clostridiales bacterium]|nr:anaerobic ribonucleoside-triphosphate reductase activating protein [Clostridiales bacterium]HAW16039.1 anaerobic ribonucleoside-triphosphate reductase activating protein [Clostridiales bacterium]